MGRSSYRLRTNQTVSDILKSITKEQSATITDAGADINSVIDDSSMEISGILKMQSYEIPGGTSAVFIDIPLNLIQENSYLLNHILYGKNIIPEIATEDTVYVNGVACSPILSQIGFGYSLSLAFPDEKNPFISTNSKKIDRYRVIGESNKTVILNSLKNTRASRQSIFTTLEFDISKFVVVLLDGILVESSKYIIQNSTTILFDFEVPTSVTLQIFVTTYNADIYPMNSFKSRSSGITHEAFITNVFDSVQVTKLKNEIFRIENNGSKLFASSLKIGDSYFTYLYDSIYLLTDGDSLADGNYTNCKQYAKIWGKLSNDFYALAGTIDYRVENIYLVEGILLW